jgi:hypothetical protein
LVSLGAFTVNFAGYTDAEIQRWLHLRAIEWSGFPGYLAQIIAPILFIFYPWWQVLLGVFLISLPWCIVRYWFVIPEFSDKICLVVVWFKWPICIGSAIYLFFHQQPVAGVVALLVPLVAGFLTPPGKVGIIELQLAKSIGYVPLDAEI